MAEDAGRNCPSIAHPLTVYVDRLRGGATQPLDAELTSDDLAVNDDEARIDSATTVRGEATLADEELVIHFSAKTQARVPCTVCSADVSIPVEVTDCYHAVEKDDYKTGVYDASALVREELVMALPRFVECGGQCPERETVGTYLTEADVGVSDKPQDGHQPFADL